MLSCVAFFYYVMTDIELGREIMALCKCVCTHTHARRTCGRASFRTVYVYNVTCNLTVRNHNIKISPSSVLPGIIVQCLDARTSPTSNPTMLMNEPNNFNLYKPGMVFVLQLQS